MRKDKDPAKDIRQNLYNLRRGNRERFLKLMGVDVKALRKLEEEADSQFGELAASLQKERRETGEERAKEHEALLRKSQKQLSSEIKRYALPPIGPDPIEAAKKYHPASPIPEISNITIGRSTGIALEFYYPYFYWCWCLWYQFFSSIADTNETGPDLIEVDPPNSPDVPTVIFDVGNKIAQPYVSVGSPGTGNTRIAKASPRFTFFFEPEQDGTYCIEPDVFMSGWWLLWVWGSCSGTPEDRGIGNIRLTLSLEARQEGQQKGYRQYTVMEQNSETSTSDEGGIDYASPRDGGSRFEATEIEANKVVLVDVQCIVEGQMTNNGRVIVDMQTSSNFYFKVPLLKVGLKYCWPYYYVYQPLAQLSK